ncbi:MAG: hypothetical protein ABR884_00415 [Minisyncoccia bacterium]
MDFSIVYLAWRLLYRFLDFFHHWYVDGSRAFGRRFMVTLTAADQSFAVAITLRHFFEPLYKDYSIVGRVLGIVFRSARVVIGGVCYLFLAVAFAIAYAIWLAIPAVIIFYVAKNI